MAINAEQLNIILSAQTKDLRQELDKAKRRIENFERKSKSDLGRTAKHFDALGAAAKRLAPILAAAFSVQAIANMTRSAAEIGRLASVAGVTAEELQLFAAGAKSVGFEMDKAADVIKDVNDKVGDFLQTGGGPMADFFENIAPKVGVTADQFARLSGPEALQLYVDSLEAANLSQSEMTFYMEALANDATALLPLLQDNGKAMREIGDEALRSGRILDQDAVDGARELEREMGELGDAIKKQLTQAIIQNQDELLALVEFISTKVIPGMAQLITLLQKYDKMAQNFLGLNIDEKIAQLSPDEEARVREDVARREGEGDISGTGQVYVTQTGEIVPLGTDAPVEEIPGITAPAPVTVTPDTVPTTDDVTGGAGGDPLDDLRQHLEDAKMLLEEYRITETEAQLLEYQNRQQMLEDALNNELLTQEEYNRLKEENEQHHVDQMAKLARAERSARLGELSGMFSALADVAEAGGKEMLGIQSTISAAAALIAAYETASKAAAEAVTIPGRIAAYAAFLAQGLQAVQAIQSIGASGSASAASGASTATTATAEQPATSSQVAIQLSGGDMFSRDQVISLINSINEAVEDGAELRLV